MVLINSTVLMSSAAYFSNEAPINPYYAEETVDLSKAQHEHDSIRQALTKAGVRVISVGAPSTSQDGVYTANWALVRGDKAVLARLPNARKTEEDWAEEILANNGLEVIRVPEDWHYSGQGDALACGNYLFCGKNYRSDERAQEFAADILGFERIQLQTIPQLDDDGNEVINQSSGWADSFYYDIDLALSIIRPPTDGNKGLIAYCPEAFTKESQAILTDFDKVDKIIVSEKEAKQSFACNLVSTGETVVMSSSAPELAANLQARGLSIITPDVSELAKGGGYIRCTSLSLQ